MKCPGYSRRTLPVVLLAGHIAAMVFVYADLFLPIARDGVYAPFWTDEYGYFADAKSFVENGTVHRVRLLEENTAALGQQEGTGLLNRWSTERSSGSRVSNPCRSSCQTSSRS